VPGGNVPGGRVRGRRASRERAASGPPRNDRTPGQVPPEPSALRIIRAAVQAGDRGDRIADAVAAVARGVGGQTGAAWLGLAAAWEVATEAGAPLAACLRELAASFRDLGQLHRDLQVALAGPAATARLVTALPVGGILVGALMGFDALHVLFLTVPGWLCLLTGAGLMFVAQRWNRRLVRSAARADATPGLVLDLTAIAMAGGGSVSRARSIVLAVTERFGIACGELAQTAVARVLVLSERAGVPAAELLRSEAQQQRRDERTAGQRRAESLGVTLMLPLGLCVLPAFMLVGVVPLVMSILSSTLGSF
jgi:tight adherence protein B